ncbi:MAG: hypothetical protein QUV35_15145 [Hydrogenophaga sp.]|uniref:hypothetical protein n=1 Tax=Hydrogenophaga sp. TaxID=1904254 RepID=UPI0026333C2F|nr:hypothetical protein [Hydrogenophaga sp.]MDM7943958.1 hypothetical protein [Hydrogenophaga sp.]
MNLLDPVTGVPKNVAQWPVRPWRSCAPLGRHADPRATASPFKSSLSFVLNPKTIRELK